MLSLLVVDLTCLGTRCGAKAWFDGCGARRNCGAYLADHAGVSSGSCAHRCSFFDSLGAGCVRMTDGREVISGRGHAADQRRTRRGTKHRRAAQNILRQRSDLVLPIELARHNLVVAHRLRLSRSLARLFELLFNVLQQVSIVDLAQLMPLSLERVNLCQLRLCFALLVPEVLKLFLEISIELADDLAFALFELLAHLLHGGRDLLQVVLRRRLEQFLVRTDLLNRRAEHIFEDLGVLELLGEAVALLLGRLVDRAYLMILVVAGQDAVDAQHATVLKAVTLYTLAMHVTQLRSATG